jgi:diacylglycerol O-acyltransferase
MARYTYERLSAQDNTFLLMERPSVHMHVAATQLYSAGPLRKSDGGIDIAQFRKSIESILHLVPRYRQVLKYIPFENHPVWIDDRDFDLNYHVRHTSLPRPGNQDQLRRLSARIMAQQLDRNKPLWEYWVVEGLEDDRFAVVSKIHHCMIDGSSGVDLARIMMSTSPESKLHTPRTYIPRPAPTDRELLVDQIARRLAMPLQVVRGLREFGRQADDLRHEVMTRFNALAELAGYAMSAASATPLNGALGPHRRVDWLAMDLGDVKGIRRALGCTVNDVVLATVSGAVRKYLVRRRVNPDEIDFRVSAPVSVRRDEDRGKLGNKVSSWILPLPIDKATPLERLEELNRRTKDLKKSKQALGVEMLMAAAEWAPSTLLSLGSQATSGPINMIVTNVPGPQMPLYTLGAELLEMYPQVPLLDTTGLGIALFSYNGKLFWGFNSDPDLVPDLQAFVAEIKAAFAELQHLASTRPALKATVKQLRVADKQEESAALASGKKVGRKTATKGRAKTAGSKRSSKQRVSRRR